MEKHEFVLHLSLQQMAMIRVAINVWNLAEHLNLLNTMIYDDLIFPKGVKEKALSTYPLPKLMEQEFLETLEPIAIQILKWKKRHATVLHDPGNFLDKLCWTSIGTVDNHKSAKILIQQEQIDISSKYRLACMYCLENDIPLIWKKIPENAKEDFRERSKMFGLPDSLVTIWSHKLDHEENKLSGFCRLCNISTRPNCNNYQYAFEIAIKSANKEAANYFLQRLTPDERSESLLSPVVFHTWLTQCSVANLCRKLINFSDVVVYLLSQMNEEEQMGMFRLGTLPIMISFLEWPWHFLFKRVSEISLKYYLFDAYKTVLKVLARGREICGYYFTKLLDEFLQVSPYRLKCHFIDRSYYLRCHFFNSYNSNCLNIILRNLGSSDIEKENLITSLEGRRYFVNLIDKEEWVLLKLLIADSALSEKSKERVKDAFQGTLWYDSDDFLARHNKSRDWPRFFQLIDNVNVEDCSKRNLEDMEAGEGSRKRLK